jgi:prepilin-type N-terminal cleavage/methylation domain-containing protein
MNSSRISSERGFTLVEMLLSMAIITLLIGLALPIYQGFQNRNDLAGTTQSVVETLRRAESYARSANADSQWGVNFQAGSVTLFSGTSYAGRNTAYDEVLSVPSTITFSYSGDVLFSKLTGFPTATLSQTLSGNGSTKVVTMNAKGMVDG